MWHTLENIATSRRIDPKKLHDFVHSSKYQHKLDDSGMISTWYVNDLVKDFRAMGTE